MLADDLAALLGEGKGSRALRALHYLQGQAALAHVVPEEAEVEHSLDSLPHLLRFDSLLPLPDLVLNHCPKCSELNLVVHSPNMKCVLTLGAGLLQSKAPSAKVVKALNMHFAKNMDTGRIGNQQLTFFAAGDDKDAKARTLELGRDLGFDPVDAGPLENARLLESLGNLTIKLGFAQGMETSIGFGLVRMQS